MCDHCHLTGKYRGAAHRSCNLNYRVPKAKYDADLVIKRLGKTEGKLNCIAESEEKYISFSKKVKVGSCKDKDGVERDDFIELRFIDSLKVMITGNNLEKLVKNLTPKCFNNLYDYFGKNIVKKR